MTDAGPTSDVPGPHGGQPIVTAGAPRGATEAVVLALHGRGTTAQGIVNLLDPVARHGVTFVAPNAHRSRWYPHATDAPRDRNEPHRTSALAVVDALVGHVVDGFGVPRERILVVGFSQGACVGAEYVAGHPTRYGGLAVLSGSLLGPTVDCGRYRGSLDGTPVFVGSGADDPHVPADRTRATADCFRALDADVTERRYDGVGHEVTDDEFGAVEAMLDDLLG